MFYTIYCSVGDVVKSSLGDVVGDLRRLDEARRAVVAEFKSKMEEYKQRYTGGKLKMLFKSKKKREKAIEAIGRARSEAIQATRNYLTRLFETTPLDDINGVLEKANSCIGEIEHISTGDEQLDASSAHDVRGLRTWFAQGRSGLVNLSNAAAEIEGQIRGVLEGKLDDPSRVRTLLVAFKDRRLEQYESKLKSAIQERAQKILMSDVRKITRTDINVLKEAGVSTEGIMQEVYRLKFSGEDIPLMLTLGEQIAYDKYRKARTVLGLRDLFRSKGIIMFLARLEGRPEAMQYVQQMYGSSVRLESFRKFVDTALEFYRREGQSFLHELSGATGVPTYLIQLFMDAYNDADRGLLIHGTQPDYIISITLGKGLRYILSAIEARDNLTESGKQTSLTDMDKKIAKRFDTKFYFNAISDPTLYNPSNHLYTPGMWEVLRGLNNVRNLSLAMSFLFIKLNTEGEKSVSVAVNEIIKLIKMARLDGVQYNITEKEMSARQVLADIFGPDVLRQGVAEGLGNLLKVAEAGCLVASAGYGPISPRDTYHGAISDSSEDSMRKMYMHFVERHKLRRLRERTKKSGRRRKKTNG